MKYFIRYCFFLVSLPVFSNDGAYYASGNQLIPIHETDISVKKEILYIKKTSHRTVEVSVYYEFYNPKDEKEISVGFEAFAPSGDVDGAPVNGQHPYMRDFTVELNGWILPYEVAYVSDSLYAGNGQVNSIDLSLFKGDVSGNYIDFFYVYHFKANFKKGLNIIQHTYNYDLSGSIENNYDFGYILTAANRWGNQQIDDFTLILDMGDFETFTIHKEFFTSNKEWIINGIGKTAETTDEKVVPSKEAITFHIRKGIVSFQKMNFRPKGELYVYCSNFFPAEEQFNHRTCSLPFSPDQLNFIGNPASEFDKKIMRNLPFARRGYVFKDATIQRYFETKTDWYVPNPNYIPEVRYLTEKEKKWIETIDKL